MRTVLACLVVALCVAAAAAATHPDTRARRYALPARTMMFSGYFRGHHYPHGGGGFRHYVPRNYEPEGAMTAFAAGNTVSAGSYYGSNGGVTPPECGQCNGNGNGHGYGNGNGNGNGNGHGNAIPAGDEPAPSPPEVIPVNGGGGGVVPDELPAADAPAYPGDEADAAGLPEQPATEGPVFDAADPQEPEDAPAPPPANGNGNGKKNGNGNGNGNGKKNGNGHGNGNGNGKGNGNGGKTRPRADDDDYSEEEEDYPALPGKRGRGRGGFYNTYFPMFFGGYPGGRSGAAGGETPGVATAIANSFSRGRGAVATSHATAYGGPHLLGGNGSRKAAILEGEISF